MDIKDVTLSVRGRKISGLLHIPDWKSPFCVIVSHGLRSNKASDKYVELATQLCREGFAVLRFDFSGCGQSEGRFEDSTITGRLEELDGAIDFVRREVACGDRIGLMGSSLGGYLSLWKAAKQTDVKAVVTWATPYRLSRPGPDAEEGRSLSEGFYEDLKNHDLVSLLDMIHHCLVIHGDMDELVPVTHATLIYDNVRQPKRLELIKGGDHRLTNPDHRKAACRLTTAWFRGHLNV
ncbi:MAG: alpha/beta fold hydrolase [Proteobacteria bacterium]|nr:alpha/beta fold hydrolase [Pseudomonadota bacterium]